ncbi:MAG: peptide chain release factor 1 [Deltaproteobacteria bacterium]|nr:peptide chain release factor 1 [Deltaproteobacteria bacterium]
MSMHPKEAAIRIAEIDQSMMDQAVLSNQRKLKEISQERARLSPIVEIWESLVRARGELKDTKELMSDPEFREMAQEEHDELVELVSELETQLRIALIPPDPYEGRDIIVEIRAGTGGDEAGLFAGDLLRMYMRYCDSHRWKTEILSSSEVTVGGAGGKAVQGFKEVIFQVSGQDAYKYLRHESGVHRVQRVPLTETQGRVHTSAATVAIMPVADSVELNIEEKDLRIDVYRASGPGGQSVNTTDSAVRITHVPTGVVVQCQDEKSQHKNKAKAMKVLSARILEQQQAEAAAEQAEQRRAQVGSGDRSERIRTYNYPQNRLTDHRVGLTLYKLDRIMEGEMEPVVEAMMEAVLQQVPTDIPDEEEA